MFWPLGIDGGFGVANADVWQIPVEVTEQTTSPFAQVYQTPVEVIEQTGSPQALVFQIAVEVVYPFRCADIPTPTPGTGQTPAEECGIAGFVGAADVLIAKTGRVGTPVARAGAADVHLSFFGRDRSEP